MDWIRRLRLLLLATMTSAGCGDGAAAPDTANTIDRIVVEPASFHLGVGETTTLVATPRNSDGGIVNGQPVEWTTSSTSIASVSAAGVVSGVGPGSVTITASAGGKSGSVSGSVEETFLMTPSGGTVNGANGRVTLVFPEGAVTASVRISVGQSTGFPPDARVVPGAAFRFGPSGLQFNVPVEVRINYGALPASHTGTGAYLWLHKLVEGAWVPIPGSPSDTVAAIVRGSLSSFSDYAAVLSELASDLQALQVALNRVLADPIAQHALTFLDALERLLAQQDNALFQQLVVPVRNAMSATACNAQKNAINVARNTVVDDYKKFEALLVPAYSWSAISDSLAPGACDPPISFISLHAQKIEQFVNFYGVRLDQPDFTADFTLLLEEARGIRALRQVATLLGYPELETRLVDDAQVPLYHKLRASAYTACRNQAKHQFLGELRTSVALASTEAPFTEDEILEELQFCATRLTWRLRDAQATTVGNGTMGGGSTPGSITRLAASQGVSSGQLELSGDVRAFRCDSVTIAPDELVVLFRGVEVRRIQQGLGGNFFASPVTLDMSQLVAAAAINTTAAGTYPLEVARETGGCGAFYVESASVPVQLARVNLTYPASAQSTAITITASPHHLGNSGEGEDYNSIFTVPTAFDSATVSITFVYPNSVDKAPEIDAGAPRIFVNGQQIGLTAADFPNIPGCISNTAVREYLCTVTITVPATSAVLVGQNTIRVASEAAFGGDDDFVFANLLVTIWR
jgi:hypothetical protein